MKAARDYPILTVTAKGKNGIKSGADSEDGEASLTIQDLTLTVDAPVNDAINAESLLVIPSGSLTVNAGDDAIHSDLTLNIGAEGKEGPAIDIQSCCEGLEGACVNIYSGDITVRSTDDCINAADSDLKDVTSAVNIIGGKIDAYTSGGDGFDSNGDLTISGGIVSVWTASTADNQPLDADGTVTVSGGTVLAAGGSSGMGLNLQADQPCLIFSGSRGMGQGSSLATAGSAFAITDASGSTLYEGTAQCNASYLFFSSDRLTEGESCTLASGDSQTGAEVQTGAVTSGMGGFGGGHGGMGRPDGDRRNTDGERPDFDGKTPPEGNPPDGNPPDGKMDGGQQPPAQK